MFDVAPSELLLIVIAAIVVIGPKDLPRALYKLGQVLGKARGMARHFRSGVDAMIREAELEELQKQWAKQNEQIMADTRLSASDATTPAEADQSGGYLPAPEGGADDTGQRTPEAGVTLGELAGRNDIDTTNSEAANTVPKQADLPLDAPATLPEETRPA